MNGSLRARIVLWTFAVVVILLVALPSLLIIPLSFSSGQTLRFPQPGFSLRWYGVFFDPFFFQAEDGIRGRNVTGVQTCALPISSPPRPPLRRQARCQVVPRRRGGRGGDVPEHPHGEGVGRRAHRVRPER